MPVGLTLLLAVSTLQVGLFAGDQNLVDRNGGISRRDSVSLAFPDSIRRVYAGIGLSVTDEIYEGKRYSLRVGAAVVLGFEGFCVPHVRCPWPQGGSGTYPVRYEVGESTRLQTVPNRGLVTGMAPHIGVDWKHFGLQVGFNAATQRLDDPGAFVTPTFRMRFGPRQWHFAVGYDVLGVSTVTSPTVFLGLRIALPAHGSLWLAVGMGYHADASYAASRIDLDITVPLLPRFDQKTYMTVGFSYFDADNWERSPRFEWRSAVGVRF